MKFTLASCVAALATIVAAKPSFTNSNFDVVYGQPFELKWANAKGPVTIELKSGTPPNSLKTYSVLATGVTGTSFTVTLKDIPTGQYAFTVRDGEGEENTNYSSAFSITGTSASVTSSTATSTSASSSTSSVSSSSSVTSSASSSTSMTTSVTSASSSSATSSSSKTSTSTTPTTTPSSIPNNNSPGNKVQSSLAMVFLGAVAYAFFV